MPRKTTGDKVYELRKKNNQSPINIHFSYFKGDAMDKIIEEIKLRTTKTKVSIVKDALLYYKVFIDNVMKTDTNKNELNEE